MKLNIEKISNELSQGKFREVYPQMSEDIEWIIIGSSIFKGKKAVVEQCEKMLIEMAGSILITTNQVVSGNQVAIQGYCNYKGENNEPCRVEYCDIYKFKEEQLVGIVSYMVDMKNVEG